MTNPVNDKDPSATVEPVIVEIAQQLKGSPRQSNSSPHTRRLLKNNQSAASVRKIVESGNHRPSRDKI